MNIETARIKPTTCKGILFFIGFFLLSSVSSFAIYSDSASISVSVDVSDLRNSKGTVQFALYNNEDAFPDKDYEKYFKKITAKIVNGEASVTFENLPQGKYAVNILHDEDNDGKIKMGFIFPKEGIGFSNYQSIGLSNRPNFSKASFEVKENKTISVKVIYM